MFVALWEFLGKFQFKSFSYIPKVMFNVVCIDSFELLVNNIACQAKYDLFISRRLFSLFFSVFFLYFSAPRNSTTTCCIFNFDKIYVLIVVNHFSP